MSIVEYKVVSYHPIRHRLQIKVVLPTPNDQTLLRMSAWRPGRYEEGNFSRLVSHLQGFDEKNERIRIQKSSKNTWTADTKNSQSLALTYLYYAAELTAGNTYLDENLLLINPVNSLIYSNEIFNSEIKISLSIKDDWKICGLEHKDDQSIFNGVDELFDTPILASSQITTDQYAVGNTRFYIHQLGTNKTDPKNIVEDFKSFTLSQIDAFGGFPVDVFSFILIGTPKKYLHGVEHLNSTVILLGPENEWNDKRYPNLLHVASHELFHVWNIKTLRPIEMLPYNFQELNYSRLGYIYEGITTYLGDYHLLNCGLLNRDGYLLILSEKMQTHIDNPGRFSMSLADSSVDTWVDGYVNGTPGRKVSIYNEGALIAFVLDTWIRSKTNNKFQLQSVMKKMYADFGSNPKGYDEQGFKNVIQEITGDCYDALFEDYIQQAQGYESIFQEACGYYGIAYTQTVSKIVSERELGMKISCSATKTSISSIADGSPADVGGLREGDELTHLNGEAVSENFNDLLDKTSGSDYNVSIKRNGFTKVVTLPLVQRTFYPTVKLSFIETDTQKIHINRKKFGF